MRDDQGIPLTAGACRLPNRRWIAAAPVEREVTLFRAITGDTVSAEDFEPQDPEYAAEAEMPEIRRLGISHYVSIDKLKDSAAWRDDKTAVAVAIPANPRVHLARTGKPARGHVCVWAPEGTLATWATPVLES